MHGGGGQGSDKETDGMNDQTKSEARMTGQTHSQVDGG